jgi:di/tricarboxylate transporter
MNKTHGRMTEDVTAAAGLRAGAVVLICIALALSLRLSGAPPVMANTASLVGLAIGFWALGVLPEALTGLLFMLGAVTIAGLDPSVVFSGFSTTAFWLIFAGVILSASTTRTGLSHWLAGRFLTARFGTAGYGMRVTAVVGFSAALALILPSTLARVAILLPLVIALCDHFGYRVGGPGRAGLVLAAAVGTYIVPITFLPANLPNIVLAGSLESLHGVTLTFGPYLLLHFPVIGLVKGMGLVLILTCLFRELPTSDSDPTPADPGPLSGSALRLMGVLGVTLVLWSLDFLHGVSPAWVALGAAVLCLMPFMRIVDLKAMPFNTAFPMLLYLGAVLGIGAAMIASGAGEAMSRILVTNLPLEGSGNALRLAMLGLVATLTSLLTTTPVAPAMTAPFFGEIATSTGWTIEAVAMSQVLGYATPLLPYQLPPLMLAIAMAGISMRDATRVLLLLALLTTPITLISAHFWWQALGWY